MNNFIVFCTNKQFLLLASVIVHSAWDVFLYASRLGRPTCVPYSGYMWSMVARALLNVKQKLQCLSSIYTVWMLLEIGRSFRVRVRTIQNGAWSISRTNYSTKNDRVPMCWYTWTWTWTWIEKILCIFKHSYRWIIVSMFLKSILEPIDWVGFNNNNLW